MKEPESASSDSDRIDCPFCGKMHFPGLEAAEATGWEWNEGEICEHLLFLLVDLPSYSGFDYRSKLFNQHLSLPDSDEPEIVIPADEDPEEFLRSSEIIERISLPGLELFVYDDGRGEVTYGFVPQRAN
ncbi:MAG: hypothetical protein RLZZ224_1613 [Verrucomicrobiota bacterium]|jgi:hypothetical protein